MERFVPMARKRAKRVSVVARSVAAVASQNASWCNICSLPDMLH